MDADLKSFFDTIPHDRSMGRLRERIADERLLRLIESFRKAGIFDGESEFEPEAGAPQGAVPSPLSSSIYPNPLDYLVAKLGFESAFGRLIRMRPGKPDAGDPPVRFGGRGDQCGLPYP